jgi:hypothetical protein
MIEKVYSPIDDRKNLKNVKNLRNSKIWKNCFKEDEYKAVLDAHTTMFCYRVKFDGTIPVQLNKVEQIK